MRRISIPLNGRRVSAPPTPNTVRSERPHEAHPAVVSDIIPAPRLIFNEGFFSFAIFENIRTMFAAKRTATVMCKITESAL